MKTERVTLLTTADFKAFLGAEAQREGVSVAELVRSRCERRPSEEELLLASLTGRLNRSVADARRSLKEGLDEAGAVLRELRARSLPAPAPAPARRRARATPSRA